MTRFSPDDSSLSFLPFLVVLGVGLFVFSACSQTQDVTEGYGADDARTATAQITSINGGDVTGTIRFREEGELVRISGRVRELSQGKHGFHVHEGTSCQDRGGHYNPDNEPHGSPDEPERHVGDLGNLVADEGNSAEYERVDRLVSLSGDQSIIGHALVIHQDADEYLPQPSGDSGAEIACGIIESGV